MVIKGGTGLEKALAKVGSKLAGKKPTLRVGFLENATYPNGTRVAMIAAIQDLGAPRAGIPPRPFFRNMIAAKKGEWPKTVAALLKANDYDGEKVMALMGEGIKGQLQQSIRDTNTPALKPATARRKGFDKPLIDTGHMLNSVDYEVKS